VAFFMLSIDSQEKNEAFAKSEKGNFPLLSDPEKQLADAYGVLASGGLYSKRWTFYIDRSGIIQYIDKSVDAESAGPDIVKRLDELGLSKPE